MDNQEIKRAQAELLATSLPATEAIYREKQIVLRVRVRDMTVNDWGVTMHADVIPSSGFCGPARPGVFRFSGAWEVLSVSAASVNASYAGWTLYFDTDLLAEILALAETLRGAADDWVKLSRRIDEWVFRAHSTRSIPH